MIIGMIIGFSILATYFSIFIGSWYLLDRGLFETEYFERQFRTIHYVRQVDVNKIWHTTTYESEVVEYHKKWWQFNNIEPLPDKWVFDSDETKKMWEKINND